MKIHEHLKKPIQFQSTYTMLKWKNKKQKRKKKKKA